MTAINTMSFDNSQMFTFALNIIMLSKDTSSKQEENTNYRQ